MDKILLAGTFDILHPGHINLLHQAKELGDFLIVVIARDNNVLKVKGRKAYFDENQRRLNLEKLNLADKVILGDLEDKFKTIKEEKPRRIALGYDQQAVIDPLQDLITHSDLSSSIEVLEPFREDICKGKTIRQAVEDGQAGFLLIDKPTDWTSHDVVAKLRNLTGLRQIGHTGTLDPFATGLLICALGQATKMTGLFDFLPKTYEATLKLGATSDTYDRTGKLEIKQTEVNIPESGIKEALKPFLGRQEQLPPMYSAKKVKGKKLYELARLGKIIPRKASEIEIYTLEILKLSGSVLKLRIECSAGTYIRSLAHDLGRKLGFGALLEELKRTAIGDFKIEEALQLGGLTRENYLRHLITPLKAIGRVNESYIRHVWR